MSPLTEWSLRLRNFLASKGKARYWVAGQQDYVKFIILSRGRTGSNLLVDYLRSHPEAIVRGELFNQRIYADQWQEIERNPVRHLWREAYHPYWRGVKAVGFKLFYFHAKTGASRLTEIWGHLRDDPGLRVVHLVRDNMLRTHVSQAIAKRTDVWLQHDSAANLDLTDRRVELDPDECRADFERTEKWWAEARALFADHPILELRYEDLVSDPASVLAEVQGFLGLSSRPLDASLKRQNPEPLDSLIANYAPLKQAFEGTPWIRFFDS